MSKKSMTEFFTRESGNEGTTLPLFNPVTGDKTDHWLKVLSIDSDAYHRANTKAMRVAAVISKMEDEEEKAKAIDEQTLNIVVALVADWSFEDPCTPENVRAFLKEAPQIRNAINVVAGDRALFSKGSSQSSADTLKPASDSTELQVVQQ